MPNYSFEKEFKPGLDRLLNQKDRCSVTIKRLGCEVIGYNVYDPKKEINLPMLWNNDNENPKFDGAWKNHATILFPHVGVLKDKKSRIGDIQIKTPKGHGFARLSVFELVEHNCDECVQATYRLTSSNETKQYYPFNFILDITYTLRERDLGIAFNITNTDNTKIYLSFGWHPGFNTELGLGGIRKDWQIILPDGVYKKYHVPEADDSFLTGETSEIAVRNMLPWTDDDLHFTLAFEVNDKKNRRCRLYNPKLKYGIDMIFTDFPYLGIWANRGQDYICIEPWQGMDDHFEQESFDQKVGIISIEPGRKAKRSAEVRPILGEVSI